MVKKIAIGTLAIAAVGTFVFGTDALSYLTTGANTVRDAVRSEVPVEFEIERARQVVENLVPEIRKSMHVIAEQEVDIANLREAIQRQELKLAEQEEAILTLSDDLKSDEVRFVYDARSFTRKEVQKDLADRFNRFKMAQEALQRDKESLSAKEQALASMRTKLEEMLSARKDMEVQIDRLEARLRSVQAAETIAGLEIDDSELTRARQLITRIDKELDVRLRMVHAESEFTGTIPVEKSKEVPEDIEEQVANYFQDAQLKRGAELTSHRPE